MPSNFKYMFTQQTIKGNIGYKLEVGDEVIVTLSSWCALIAISRCCHVTL